MKIKKSNLYEIIRAICEKNYILGIHGTYNVQKPSREDSLETANHIINKGLVNFSSDSTPRNIHRTVKFLGKLDDERDKINIVSQLQSYKWMNGSVYLLVAIPRIFYNLNNESLYLGIPNNDLIIYAEDTSFLDKVTYGIVPHFFILGYYYEINDTYLNLTLNPLHVAFHDSTVLDSYFQEIKLKLILALRNSECPLLHENMKQEELLQLKRYLKKLGYNKEVNYQQISKKYWDQLWISETIRQFFDEQNNILLPKSKFTNQQILKILED